MKCLTPLVLLLASPTAPLGITATDVRLALTPPLVRVPLIVLKVLGAATTLQLLLEIPMLLVLVLRVILTTRLLLVRLWPMMKTFAPRNT